MDQTAAAFVHEAAEFGLVPFVAIGIGIAVVVVLCAFFFPTWKRNLESQQEIEKMKAEAQIDLERKREDRKAQEARQQAEDNRKRIEIDSQNAVLFEGFKVSLDTLISNQERNNALLEGSRGNSAKMGSTVEDTNRKVTEIHHALIN